MALPAYPANVPPSSKEILKRGPGPGDAVPFAVVKSRVLLIWSAARMIVKFGESPEIVMFALVRVPATVLIVTVPE